MYDGWDSGGGELLVMTVLLVDGGKTAMALVGTGDDEGNTICGAGAGLLSVLGAGFATETSIFGNESAKQ